jgi:hypothetical protein
MWSGLNCIRNLGSYQDDPEGKRKSASSQTGQAAFVLAAADVQLDGGGNVLGMMPHPENHVEDIRGCTDSRGLFAHLERAA